MKAAVHCTLTVLLFAGLHGSSFGQATYRVDFDVTWSAGTHPGAYPSSAHFSPLIGITHDSSVNFWEPGGIASPGIEQMAETGATSILRNEITAATGRTNYLSSTTIFGTGRRSVNFDVEKDESLLTLVTMVAPSPDWFVGVNSLDLYAGGAWADGLVVDLFAWDAGTDSGVNFSSGDQDTNPQTPITRLGNPLPDTLPALGTFTFTLLAVPEPSSMLLAMTGVIATLSSRRTLRR